MLVSCYFCKIAAQKYAFLFYLTTLLPNKCGSIAKLLHFRYLLWGNRYAVVLLNRMLMLEGRLRKRVCGRRAKELGLPSLPHTCYRAWKRCLLPTKGAGTEYGSLTAIEGRDEEFGFAFHRVEHVLVIGFAKGLHEVFACFGQTAEENEGFG